MYRDYWEIEFRFYQKEVLDHFVKRCEMAFKEEHFEEAYGNIRNVIDDAFDSINATYISEVEKINGKI